MQVRTGMENLPRKLSANVNFCTKMWLLQIDKVAHEQNKRGNDDDDGDDGSLNFLMRK